MTIQATMRWLAGAGGWAWQASIQAALLIAIIGVLRVALGRRWSPRWRSVLWFVVAVRLVLPGFIATAWSPSNAPTWLGGWFSKHESTSVPIVSNGAPPASASSPSVESKSGSEPNSFKITTGYLPRVEVESAPKVISSPALATVESAWRPATVLALVWLAGVGAMLARILASQWAIARAVRRMQSVDDGRVIDIVTRSAREMRLRWLPRIVATDRVRTPAVAGIGRGTLILPSDLSLSDRDLRLVCLHEFAHLRRHDPLTELISRLLLALHWFDPLVWLAVSMSRSDRETACDLAVLRQVGATEEGSNDYARCLVGIVERMASLRPHPASIGVLGAARKHRLRRRIDMIMNDPIERTRHPLLKGFVGVLACAAIAVVAATGPSRGDDKPIGTEPAKPTVDPAKVKANPESAPAKAPATSPLDLRLDEIAFDATPFKDTIDQLSKKAGVDFYVNWKALEAAGIDRATQVNARLHNITLAKTLRIILDDVGGGSVRLGYEFDDGTITVSTEEELSKNVVTRTIDIRDLLVNYDSFAAFGTPTTQPAADSKPPTRQELVDQIIKLIEQTIASESWKDNGGATGSIKELSGQLCITATPTTQAAILQLLNQLREGRGVQIVVDSRIVAVDFDKLPENLRKLLEFPQSAEAAEVSNKSVFLSQEQADQLSAELKKDNTSGVVLSGPRLTIFNGQRAFVRVCADQTYLSDYTVIKQADGSTRYEPVMGTCSDGVTVDVQATASADRKYVTITVRPKITKLLRIDQELFNGNKDLPVQRPVVEEHSVDATVSVPDGGTVVFRTAGSKGNAKQIILFLVRPALIIHKEVDAPSFPLLENQP